MRSICLLMAVLVCGVSYAGKRKPAPLTSTEVEYPLSCSAKAKPLVFEGWNALSNGRPEDAKQQLGLALAADPRCVLARASLGPVASSEAWRLTPVERLHLQVLSASRAGDLKRAFALAHRLEQQAPRVMMARLTAAQAALAAGRWNEAAASATAATELTPMNGAGWFLLGQARLQAGFVDEAVAAFRKYAEVAPTEANAHDALGDALLAHGELEAAGTSYQRAIDRSKGKLWRAWGDLATVLALSGDWTAARAAIDTYRSSAREPSDRRHADVMLAWTYAAEGRMTEALRVADALKDELFRGELLLASGKHAAALGAFSVAATRPRSRAQALAGTTVAQAQLGRTADAARTLRRLEALGNSPQVAELRAYARGALALAQKAPRRALESLGECSEPFDACRLLYVEALFSAGDTADALEARARLATANHRDPHYWLIHSQLAAATGVTSLRGPNPPAR